MGNLASLMGTAEGKKYEWDNNNPTLWDFMYCSMVTLAHFKGGWRMGQVYMNILYKMKPTLYNCIQESSINPFYKDANCDDFLFFVVRTWDSPPNTIYHVDEWMKQNKEEILEVY